MGYRWRRFWRRLRLARPSPKLILAAAGLFLLWAAASLGKGRTVDFEAYRVQLAEKVMEGWFPASQYGIKDSVFAFCEPILFRYLARQEAGQDPPGAELAETGRGEAGLTGTELAETERAGAETAELGSAGTGLGGAELAGAGLEPENRSPETAPAAGENAEAAAEAGLGSGQRASSDFLLKKLADYDYLMQNYYSVHPTTTADRELMNAETLLGVDLTLEKDPENPQILIYHSHSQETFADSREGHVEDTIVGVGDYLAEILTETYGYQVLHVTEAFDMMGGQLDRSAAYDYARPYIEEVLKENPTIEIVIDLHRDGVPEDRKLVTEINGKPTAQIMFYNGLSYTADGGQVDYLPNPYIQDNLAFSFQLEYQAAQYYPELYRGIYLAALRYNLHLKPRALLLEAGAQTNTVQEVKNAMEPFADILNRVLSGGTQAADSGE